ncbi:MAG: carboxylesterase/lipase family protein, partial [Variovorax sp.]
VLSPLATGLLHKAVPLSGGVANSSRATAQTYSKALLNAIVIADGKATDAASAQTWVASQTDAQIASFLRGMSSSKLLTVMLANPQLGNAPAPIEDGSVLPVNSVAALAAGTYNRMPLLVGNTKDEGTLFAGLFGAVSGTGISGFKPNDYDRFGLQYNFNPDAAPTLTEADLINAPYLPVTALPRGWNAVSAAVSNSIFLGPIVPQLNSLSSQQLTQTWYYSFDWNEEPVPFNTVYGATHALDLPFLFGNFGTSAFSFAFSTANKPGREALSGAMMDSLTAFARTGNPNHAGLGVTWPHWPRRLVFDATATQLQTSAP